jgi:predicted dinucleotide-binding enzyme
MVVVDAMNYYEGRDRHREFGGLTSSELAAWHLSAACLVKAFNTMYYGTFVTSRRTEDGERFVLFVAGDDKDAKAAVSGLILIRRSASRN